MTRVASALLVVGAVGWVGLANPGCAGSTAIVTPVESELAERSQRLDGFMMSSRFSPLQTWRSLDLVQEFASAEVEVPAARCVLVVAMVREGNVLIRHEGRPGLQSLGGAWLTLCAQEDTTVDITLHAEPGQSIALGVYGANLNDREPALAAFFDPDAFAARPHPIQVSWGNLPENPFGEEESLVESVCPTWAAVEGPADTGGPQTAQPDEAGTAQTGAAQTNNAQTNNAQTRDAQTGNAQTAQTGNGQTGNGQTGAAQTGAAQTGTDPAGAARRERLARERFERGTDAMNRDAWAEAARNFEESIACHPFEPAVINLAAVRAEQGLNAEATRLYETFLERFPDAADAYRQAAETGLERLAQTTAVRVLLNEAPLFEGSCRRSGRAALQAAAEHQRRAVAAARRLEHPQALLQYQKSYVCDPRARSLLGAAETLERLGDAASAHRLYQELLGRFPRASSHYRRRASVGLQRTMNPAPELQDPPR